METSMVLKSVSWLGYVCTTDQFLYHFSYTKNWCFCYCVVNWLNIYFYTTETLLSFGHNLWQSINYSLYLTAPHVCVFFFISTDVEYVFSSIYTHLPFPFSFLLTILPEIFIKVFFKFIFFLIIEIEFGKFSFYTYINTFIWYANNTQTIQPKTS